MTTFLFLILFLILIKLVIDPKIDVTKEQDILLWYNWKNKRKFIIIN